MSHPVLYATALCSALLAAGCASVAPAPPDAQARIQPTRGNATSGQVEFRQRDGAVEVVANLRGLTPGEHGFHVHEKGDCSAPDGTSAGGHFNPSGHPHGHPDHAQRHAGDMPMLVADANGNASLKTVLTGVSVGGATGIAGKAVIVHAAPDDFKTQPTGNAGARVACGVIVAR